MRGMKACRALAFDLGASTGRGILGVLEGDALTCREVIRFDNTPVERDGHLCWDMDALLSGIRAGIARAGTIDALAFDTWGVDFGLLDEQGRLLAPPVHYRDGRTAGMPALAEKILSPAELYAATGNQIMAINTLFQLLAVKHHQPELLKRAKTLLFMPDLLAYLLSGTAACERSIASTSQMLDPTSGTWHRPLLERLGLPPEILLPPVKSGTVTGRLETGVKIVAAAGHDTQCAAAAAPLEGEGAAFLSCGTWSLLGTELPAPILTAQSAALGLSNELGANGRVNYLKNISGLWLLQESRRQWQREGQDYPFSRLEELAQAAPAFSCFIDPDDPRFAAPGDLPERIRRFCAETGQRVPESVGATVRCMYESLALKYRLALTQLAEMTGRTFDTLHIVGGGARAALLCRMSAGSCGIPAAAGPVEATALGNLIIQFTALGALPSLEAGRALIARQFPPVRYAPGGDGAAWQTAYTRFQTILTT